MAYNLRSSSLTAAHLDTELAKRGARISGTTERKQARLQRFVDSETKTNNSRENLRVVIENEQRNVVTRSQSRAAEIHNDVMSIKARLDRKGISVSSLLKALGY